MGSGLRCWLNAQWPCLLKMLAGAVIQDGMEECAFLHLGAQGCIKAGKCLLKEDSGSLDSLL